MDQILHDAIAAVIPATFATVAPPNSPLPYAIWQRIGGDPGEYLDNEPPQVEHALVQVTVFGLDTASIKLLVHQLTAALREHDYLIVSPDGGFRDDYDSDMELFSAAQDYNVRW
ncbi:DUF3168 domain-containing protein [Corticibacter populi]|uniref:DUF3168 domain-containing protein n=1 Tax=Corticibacter populi TaxID=1550736 RepID=A0A3M6QUL2_9BURK|nr:DUF3168 domain-containing protein [Corticibacter populi]RMX06714.1 DUF3168 domain-containing protein [Corticibacter populi]RZS31705.1 uncharacterized protein DUF3168 [Corticibacter populi]